MDVKREIAKNMKLVRKTRKLSQAQVAAFLGTTQGVISQYEKGITVPSVEILADFAVKFHVSLDYLFGLSTVEGGEILAPELLQSAPLGASKLYGNPDDPKTLDIEEIKKYLEAKASDK